MKIYFTLGSSGHVNGVSSTSMRIENEIRIDVPDNHEVLRNPDIYKYANGALVKDEEHQRNIIAEDEVSRNRLTDDEINALALMELTEKLLGGV